MPYAVNFEESEKYLGKLLASGFLSEKYADSQKAYFKECQKQFDENPSSEGPPQGFDFDLVLYAQEDPGLDSLHLVKSVITYSSKNTAHVSLVFPYGFRYNFDLRLTKNGWLIDSISRTD